MGPGNAKLQRTGPGHKTCASRLVSGTQLGATPRAIARLNGAFSDWGAQSGAEPVPASFAHEASSYLHDRDTPHRQLGLAIGSDSFAGFACPRRLLPSPGYKCALEASSWASHQSSRSQQAFDTLSALSFSSNSPWPLLCSRTCWPPCLATPTAASATTTQTSATASDVLQQQLGREGTGGKGSHGLIARS